MKNREIEPLRFFKNILKSARIGQITSFLALFGCELGQKSKNSKSAKKACFDKLAERGPFKTGFSHAVNSGYHFL
jgi:hypothetical protein